MHPGKGVLRSLAGASKPLVSDALRLSKRLWVKALLDKTLDVKRARWVDLASEREQWVKRTQDPGERRTLQADLSRSG
jgi:hypothetical protein